MRCINCKGKGLCGRPVCPIERRLEAALSIPALGTSIAGDSPPEVFVGRYGYPVVRAGPLVPVDGSASAACGLDSSPVLDIGEIIRARACMVRSESELHVTDALRPGRMLVVAQQIAISDRPVGTEVFFTDPPKGTIHFDGILTPSGPSGTAERIDITSNPVVPRRVDQLVGDLDALARDAAIELYQSSIDVSYISRLLSLGLLGRNRRLVPTRWSITASDDMVGRSLRGRLLDLPEIGEFELYSGELLGNHFEIILLPRPYRFELIEIWLAGSVWSPEETWIGSDSEGPEGKKEYSSLAGGYYAARLASLEHLLRIGRQASILALREITEAYWAPLGVWVVREAARKALAAPSQRFDSLDDAIFAAEGRMRTKAARWRLHSGIYRPAQTTLSSFLLPD